jgi:lipoprotein-anchoring transpeptidase ErfK/SrfK
MLVLGCEGRREPPSSIRPRQTPLAPVQITAAQQSDSEPKALGDREDNLPFAATGDSLASIAWRTWVYTEVGPRRHRYGYLRAGAVLDRRGPAIRNTGCPEGWYRINPRGFVCIGKGATLDLEHPVVIASDVRPTRGEGLPYVYALSRERAPFLYFKLPPAREMRAAEGPYHHHAVNWLARRKREGSQALMRLEPRPPSFLSSGEALQKPYGVEKPLRYRYHAGQADSDSGFALLRTFEWEGRAFGLTTELDLIPMDRTHLVAPSEFEGIVLRPKEDLPIAVVETGYVTSYAPTEGGQFGDPKAHPRRTLFALTGKKLREGRVVFWETTGGRFVPQVGVHIIAARNTFPSVATGKRKWIDISLTHQTLVAFEGKKAVFATLISSGAGGLGDPEEVPATIRGTFMIHTKHISSTMDGEDDVSDSFDLRDVPFVQYFHEGFALHAAYWHDDFGRWRSHGCVNLSPRDAAWLFEWSDPHVPKGWHSVINKKRGTVVIIHA